MGRRAGMLGNTTRLFCTRRSFTPCTFPTRRETKVVEPERYGIEHEAIDDAHDVVIFEDFGNGQTKLTFIGSEPMENAKNSGQLEGWNEQLDKVAAVVTRLAQGK
jgi:hypothetical protein